MIDRDCGSFTALASRHRAAVRTRTPGEGGSVEHVPADEAANRPVCFGIIEQQLQLRHNLPLLLLEGQPVLRSAAEGAWTEDGLLVRA